MYLDDDYGGYAITGDNNSKGRYCNFCFYYVQFGCVVNKSMIYWED